MTPHRPLTPTASSTTTSPNRYKSAPMSPTTSILRISELLENSSSSRQEEKRTPSTSMAPTLSGPNSPQLTEKSWALPRSLPESFDDGTSKTEPRTTSQVHESRWTSIWPSSEVRDSTLLTPHPSTNDSQPTQRERFGIPPWAKDYASFDPKPLMNKAPWSTPSPVSYGRRDHGTPEPSCRHPHRYEARYDMPMLLPDSPPYRWQGTYRGKGTSQLLAAAGGDDDMGAGGSGPPPDPTEAERLEQACALYHNECLRADRLEQEVEKLTKGKGLGRDPL